MTISFITLVPCRLQVNDGFAPSCSFATNCASIQIVIKTLTQTGAKLQKGIYSHPTVGIAIVCHMTIGADFKPFTWKENREYL